MTTGHVPVVSEVTEYINIIIWTGSFKLKIRKIFDIRSNHQHKNTNISVYVFFHAYLYNRKYVFPYAIVKIVLSFKKVTFVKKKIQQIYQNPLLMVRTEIKFENIRTLIANIETPIIRP